MAGTGETRAASTPVPQERSKPRSLQERFERTVVGRIAISVFLLITLIAIFTANLPVSRLKDLLLSADHAYVYGLGLDQGWGVFSPDPRRETIHVTARVAYSDGSTRVWRVPRRDPVVGEYVDYRWLKWAEFVVDPGYSNLWEPLALYAARQLASPDRRPVRVELINHYWELQPPGAIPDHPFVQQRTIFTTQVTEAMLRGTQ